MLFESRVLTFGKGMHKYTTWKSEENSEGICGHRLGLKWLIRSPEILKYLSPSAHREQEMTLQ